MQLAEFLDLQQLAFDHLLREFDEGIEDGEVALCDGNLERLHVEPVSGEHALRVAPLRIGRRTPAADLRIVDDVVVHQRGRMDDLDHRSKADRSLAAVGHHLGAQEQERRPDPLAAAVPQVLADLGDGRYVGNRIASELPLDSEQVFANQLEDFFHGFCRWTVQPRAHGEANIF